MVTAELAACLPVLVLVLAVALGAVSVVGARVRLQDTASELARCSARGDASTGRRLAEQDAPGASFALTRDDGYLRATASLQVHPLGDWLPSLTVTERAVAAPEDAGASGTSP